MRVILIAIVALLVGCGLLIGNESWASQGTAGPRQSFTISKQGTLLELIGADGRSRTKKVTGDGFKLNYKTRGKSRSVSAIGTKTKQLQTSCEPAKYDGNTATAVVQTADKSLEITSELTFDPEAGELIIKRKFRNISKYPVTLQGLWNYIDQNVMGQFNQSAELVSPPSGPITGYLAGNVADCRPAKCPVPPVCNDCPLLTIPNRNLNHLIPSFGLEWPDQITLRPHRSRQHRQPGGEVSIAIRILIK